jgi:hypothetical protein
MFDSISFYLLIEHLARKLSLQFKILYLVAYIDRAAVGFAHLHMGADVGIGDAAYGLGDILFEIHVRLHFLLFTYRASCS